MPLTKPTSDLVDFLATVSLPGNLDVAGTVTAGSINTGTVSATAFTGPGTIPVGGIIMWSGSTIPTNWALCNGDVVNGIATPNLIGRMILGGLSYSSGAWRENITGSSTSSGGSKDAIAVTHNHSHSFAVAHTLSAASGGAHTHSYQVANVGTSSVAFGSGGIGLGTVTYPSSTTDGGVATGAHTHTLTGGISISGTIQDAGASGTNANLTPYYVLAFIMRVS